MFLNIFSNAVKFTDRDGKIMIMVEYQKRPKEDVEADFIMISITDDGIGIKKKNQDKLFKMFGSIKNQKKKINT